MGLLDAPSSRNVNATVVAPPIEPYHPSTRPWYLDAYWEFFLSRAFLTGQGSVATTLAATIAESVTACTVTTASGLLVGMPIVVYSPATTSTKL